MSLNPRNLQFTWKTRVLRGKLEIPMRLVDPKWVLRFSQNILKIQLLESRRKYVFQIYLSHYNFVRCSSANRKISKCNTKIYVRSEQFGCYKNLYAVSPVRMLQKPIFGQPSSDATKTYLRSVHFYTFFTFCQITEN